jgi:hypothetical protein
MALAISTGARADGTDPADLVFWDTIKNSTNPEEYKAYLQEFPTGRFAAIARLRANSAPPPVVADKQSSVAPTADAEGDVSPDPKLSVTPANGHVGQKFILGCVDFPETDTRDFLVVVPAGTPEMDPHRSRDETKILFSNFAIACKQNGGSVRDVGPFAPGRYEARYMSVLYNSENRYEMKASTTFSVR